MKPFNPDDDLVMSRDELFEAGQRLGYLIAAERGIKVDRLAELYGATRSRMQRLLQEWRSASATPWPMKTGKAAA